MTLGHLIRRSLRFHARSHLGVILGAAVGSAALVGALLVGDSVRASLRERAHERLGPTQFALQSSDRFFLEDLPTRLTQSESRAGTDFVAGPDTGAMPTRDRRALPTEWVTTALSLPGTVARQDGAARANRITVLGVTEQWAAFATGGWEAGGREQMHPFVEDAVWLNRALAAQLRAAPGDELVLRVHKPSALSRDAVITPRDDASVALRLRVAGVLGPGLLGDFDLTAGQGGVLNAFVRRDVLAGRAGLEGMANLLLVSGGEEPHPNNVVTRFKRWVGTQIPASLLARYLAWALPPRLVDPKTLAAALDAALVGGPDHDEAAWVLGDLELSVRGGSVPEDPARTNVLHPYAELVSRRIFLDPAVGRAALTPVLRTNGLSAALRASPHLATLEAFTNATPILTYLVNSFTAGERLTPYSMVTAAGPPYTPANLGDDEIVVNEWLAADLRVRPGDAVALRYYVADSGSLLTERTNVFRVRSVVPLAGPYADRTLMPEFPGLAKAESTHDWDAGFPLAHPIRDLDEAYWKQWRGTPKAFISLAAGQRLWANRFGDLTAVRWFDDPLPEQRSAAVAGSAASLASQRLRLLAQLRLAINLDPTEVGLRWQAVQQEAQRAATSGQNFGGLFIGFSFFLVLAALLLMALLFQFGLEQRLTEVGTLLAIGFRPWTVRRLWLGEGLVLAFLGSLLGVAGGVFYARAMIRGLSTVWREAVAGTALGFHAQPGTLLLGMAAAWVVCGGTLWLTLRRQFARPARELLAGEIAPPRAGRRSRGTLIGAGAGLLALALVGGAIAAGETHNPGVFFGAGSLLLIAGLALAAGWMARLGSSRARMEAGSFTPTALAIRGLTRRRSRSLATAALLASGTFLVVSLGAFRLDAQRGATDRGSGTGGFALIGSSTLPITQDLNTDAGREFFGLGTNDLPGVAFVAFRVRDGDDASCLNLNRAQRPRLLAVKPELLASRSAFSFAGRAPGVAATQPWEALRVTDLRWADRRASEANIADIASIADIPEIPAIGDAASIQWALGRKLGDTLELTDERGRPFRLRLVAGVANSILQGSLIIDDAAFVRLFPGEAGNRWFLVDAPADRADAVSTTLTRALGDVGLELTPAATRLAQFNAVQNTYLSTFQVLGGLGLLLGSAGLGVVVLRNVLERRGELALLTAVGFRREALSRLVLGEHAALLLLGLGIGLASASVAVLPALLAPTVELPLGSLGLTLGGVVLLGLVTAWAAVHVSLRGSLLAALRGE